MQNYSTGKLHCDVQIVACLQAKRDEILTYALARDYRAESQRPECKLIAILK